MDYNPSDPSKLLGKGGYAEVYRGTFNGQSVAIKRVLQTSDSLWNERESNALAQLNHPNVVRLIHEEQNGDIHFTIRYYVLELCDASLDYYFLPDSNPKKYKRSIPFDKDAFIQMSEGRLYIHSKGLVHRDVKPGNVLISSNYGIPLLKWSDFGLSRPVNERGTYTVSGIKGTIEWFAPEILVMMDEEEDSPNFNERRGTIKSDTFACGAVFFYLLSGGNHPYGKGISIASNIRDGKKVNMKALGKSWFAKDIILKMLDKDVNKRISLNDAIEGLKNTNYTIKEMFTEFKKLCRAAQLKTSKDTNELQLDRLRRLIDQKAFFDIPANEKKYIMETVCSIEKLHEPSREIVIKTLVSSKGVKLDYINSLCSILTQRHLSENHLFKVAGLLLDAAIEMHHSWNEIRASEIFFDLYIYSFLNNDLLNKITKFLIDRGLDLNERDENGANVLHYMCQYGRAFNLRNRLPLLLDLGIPIDAVDFKGRNALHCICSRSYFYSDELLLGKEEIQKEQSKRTLFATRLCVLSNIR